jgi:RNA polymerase sigma-70 factor (ECF subfamily)
MADRSPVDDRNGSDWTEVLQRARAGDRAALGEILAACRDYLQILASMQVQPRWQPKVGLSDLVQETLLDAHRDFARFQGDDVEEFQRWLAQILRNNLLDVVRHHRSSKRNVLREEPFSESGIPEFSGNDAQSRPSQVVQRAERDAQLDAALQRLPARQQTVILLRHREGLGFLEIGRRLGLTERMARYIWAEAIAALRDDLVDEP